MVEAKAKAITEYLHLVLENDVGIFLLHIFICVYSKEPLGNYYHFFVYPWKLLSLYLFPFSSTGSVF